MTDGEAPERDLILDAVTEVVGGHVTGYVLTATFFDDAGVQQVYLDYTDEQTISATIGLLEGASAIQKARLVRDFQARLDDD